MQGITWCVFLSTGMIPLLREITDYARDRAITFGPGALAEAIILAWLVFRRAKHPLGK